MIRTHRRKAILSDLPGVEMIGITNYLVLQTSCYTTSQMKVYNSLEAYNYSPSVCGGLPGTRKANEANIA